MSHVRDILSTKGSQVLTVGPDGNVLDAAILMNDYKIGCLVVTRSGKVEGILTERDILLRVVAEQREPADTPVYLVMTRQVWCVREDSPLEEVQALMADRRVRHLPVIDEERNLAGLVSMGDLNAYQCRNQEAVIRHLQQYLYGMI